MPHAHIASVVRYGWINHYTVIIAANGAEIIIDNMPHDKLRGIN